jgi:spermidine synthase
MGQFFRWRDGAPSVQVSERDGVRCLHLGSDRVQSALRVATPNCLELAYTRAMMGFLLFQDEPADVLMIGLGGGSMASFVHARMPRTRVVAVEIVPEVITAARLMFGLPPDDARLRVELADGAQFVAAHSAGADTILLDAYDDHCPTPALASGIFYAEARRALRPGGVLVANFLGDDRDLDSHLAALEREFDYRVVCVQPEPKSNVVAFALRDGPPAIAWSELRRRAAALDARYDLDFGDLLRKLRDLNGHSARSLRIVPSRPGATNVRRQKGPGRFRGEETP